MPITKMHRAAILLATAAALAAISAGPADARNDDRRTLDGMRACAKIADPAQRTSCYDGYMQPQAAAPTAAAPAAPLPAAAAVDAWAPVAPEQRRRTASVAKPKEEAHRYAAIVATAVEREPGVYLLTMRDGLQWRFASTARSSYDPPMAGSRVEIQPGSLGSFLLSYNDQSAIRVVRIR
jgi:hypothetical protein